MTINQVSTEIQTHRKNKITWSVFRRVYCTMASSVSRTSGLMNQMCKATLAQLYDALPLDIKKPARSSHEPSCKSLPIVKNL